MKKQLLTVGLILLGSIAYGQVTSGLVAKYSFNSGNATDDIGSIDGTVVGAILTSDRFGNTGKAYDFLNGEYIALPDAPALKSTTMTVSLWAKIDGYNPGPNPQNFIYSIINSTTNAYFSTFSITVNTNNDTFFGVAQNSPAESSYGATTDTNTSIWQHHVMSIDNDSIKMYIDGVLQFSNYKGFATTYTSDSIYIGISGNTTYFGNLNGSVDDIRVYNRVLSNLEVDSLFNEPNPNTAGINQSGLTEKSISIFPNPTHDFLNISSEVELNSNFCIVDITGRIVINGNIQGNSSILNIESLNNGIYFLQIGEGYTTSMKFIKK